MSVDYKTIGQRIKQRRKVIGKTQENMAEEFSVTVGYISQIERGKVKINLDLLAEISTYLDCDITELLTGTIPAQQNYLYPELEKKLSKMNETQRKFILEVADMILNFKDL